VRILDALSERRNQMKYFARATIFLFAFFVGIAGAAITGSIVSVTVSVRECPQLTDLPISKDQSPIYQTFKLADGKYYVKVVNLYNEQNNPIETGFTVNLANYQDRVIISDSGENEFSFEKTIAGVLDNNNFTAKTELEDMVIKGKLVGDNKLECSLMMDMGELPAKEVSRMEYTLISTFNNKN
jgi:hypothetical protein